MAVAIGIGITLYAYLTTIVLVLPLFLLLKRKIKISSSVSVLSGAAVAPLPYFSLFIAEFTQRGSGMMMVLAMLWLLVLPIPGAIGGLVFWLIGFAGADRQHKNPKS